MGECRKEGDRLFSERKKVVFIRYKPKNFTMRVVKYFSRDSGFGFSVLEDVQDLTRQKPEQSTVIGPSKLEQMTTGCPSSVHDCVMLW